MRNIIAIAITIIVFCTNQRLLAALCANFTLKSRRLKMSYKKFQSLATEALRSGVVTVGDFILWLKEKENI